MLRSLLRRDASVRRLAAAALIVSVPFALPTTGRAIGFELTGPGARDTGRGGASVVGADSAMGLFYNPATLLNSSAVTDTAFALHSGFTDLCYSRVAVIEGAGGRTAGESYPEVCADNKTAIIPVGASAFRFGDKFALAIGVYSPPSVGRDIRFGNQYTGTRDGSPATGVAALTPSRHLLMHEFILQTFPTIGAAWAPIKQLKIGASFGWGFTKFAFSTGSFSRATQQVFGMEAGGNSDVGNYVKGKDKFTPRVSVGLVGKPSEKLPLELAASFTWTGDVETNDGTLRVRNLYTEYFPAALSSGFAQPNIQANFGDTGVKVPQNALLQGGVRYAKKLANPVGKSGDRMSTELFDIELDYVMTFARLDAVTITPPRDAVVVAPPPSPLAQPSNIALPDEISIKHRWKNQYGIRLGGDYNVIPGTLALRLGYTFESDGIDKGYHQLDFTPFKRFGIQFGATYRIFDMIDVSATYAHFFIPDVKTSVQDAGVRRQVTGSPLAGQDVVSNAGTITQTAQALIVELGYHM